MKIVIQCCATKDCLAGSFAVNRRRVKFVAHPEYYPEDNAHDLFRPDDLIPSTRTTWREHLLTYNGRADNPDKLLQAGSLYSPSTYGTLLHSVGAENLYILSAGWGLVRSDFLLPDYDITFSSQAEPWKRRTKRDVFCDFAHLTQADIARDDAVYFFGGKEYLSLYYRLTRSLVARKVVYCASTRAITEEGFEYIRYGSAGTNWHYRCVSDFLASRIAK
jgi:hypothetical protein